MATKYQTTRPLVKSSKPCTNGPNCRFGDKCMFSHAVPTIAPFSPFSVPIPVPVHSQSIVQTTLTQCQFGLKCKKGASCTFFHGESDNYAMTWEEYLTLKELKKLGENPDEIVSELTFDSFAYGEDEEFDDDDDAIASVVATEMPSWCDPCDAD